MDRSATCIPAQFAEEGTDNDAAARRPNLSGSAQRWLERLDANVEDLFHHVLSTIPPTSKPMPVHSEMHTASASLLGA